MNNKTQLTLGNLFWKIEENCNINNSRNAEMQCEFWGE